MAADSKSSSSEEGKRIQSGRPKGNKEAVDSAAKMLEIVKELVNELQPQRKGGITVTLDSLLDRDLGLDSMGRVELFQRIENIFGTGLNVKILAAAETPRDLLREVLIAPDRGEGEPVSREVKRLVLEDVEKVPEQAGTLLEVLEWHVRTHPDRPHILFCGGSGQEEVLTYGELQQGAEKVATGLRAKDLQPGETVALMLPTGRDYFFAFFGVLFAGGIPVPLYPPTRLSQIKEHLYRQAGIITNALCPILITFPEAGTFSRFLKTRVTRLRDIVTVQELSAAREAFVRPVVKAQDIGLLQYTSGSTGNPKGVILTHDNLLANIRTMGQVVQADFTDVFVSWLPLYHDMGLIGAWLGSLYYSSLLVLMSPFTFMARPARWLWTIHKYRGTLSAAPNFAFELCLGKINDADINGLDLSSWRMAVNGAEPVIPETILGFTRRFGEYGFRPEAMAPVYGLAECSLGLAFPPPGRQPVIDSIQREPFIRSGRAIPAKEDDPSALRFAACGQPLPNHQVRIVDASGYEVGERQEGRLEFKGPSATSGYFRNAEETHRLFNGEWLDSGDKGYMVGGDVIITGRAKDIIIRAGQNIHPQELEEAVGNLAKIRKGSVAVFGSKDRDSQTERLVVLAETREIQPAALNRMRGQINRVVTDILGEPPEDVILVPPHSVPKTSSGKIRRAASRELYEQGRIGQKPQALWIQYVRLLIWGIIPQLRRFMQTTATFLYAGYVWALFVVVVPLTWITVSLISRAAWGRSVLRAMARLILKLSGTPVVVRGLENLPPKGPCVLIANHSSYLDSLLLAAVLPSSACYVAKREFTERFPTRVFLRHIGVHFVERFDFQRGILDARRLESAVRQGQWIVIYPEGTFTRYPGLLPFHMGAFVVAADTGASVIPIAIRGTRSMLRAGQWFPRRGRGHITIGDPIRPEGTDWPAALKLRDAARAEILRHCGEPDLIQAPHRV